MKPDAIETCVACGDGVEIIFDVEHGDHWGGMPRQVESIEGGLRCDNCQKVVHVKCAHETDVCDSCYDLIEGRRGRLYLC